jgi:hypothetical protein
MSIECGCQTRSEVRDPSPTHSPSRRFSCDHTEGSFYPDRERQTLSLGRSLDRNGADDGTGATAATGATDIRPRDGNSGIGRRHSNRV